MDLWHIPNGYPLAALACQYQYVSRMLSLLPLAREERVDWPCAPRIWTLIPMYFPAGRAPNRSQLAGCELPLLKLLSDGVRSYLSEHRHADHLSVAHSCKLPPCCPRT